MKRAESERPAAFSWYPGHMTRAYRKIEEDLKLVDLVLLVMDARIPRSSRHPGLEALMARRRKPVVLVLNKADLAEPAATARWLRALQSDEHFPVQVSAQSGAGMGAVGQVIARARARALEHARKAGRVDAPARLLVAGIPNVGKSSLINRLAPRGRAKTGKQPGVTRGRQWITLPGGVELLDSPGILFPRIEDRETFLHLAMVGAIREDNLPLEEIGEALAALLVRRGRLAAMEGDEPLLARVARARGMLGPGGVPDVDRAAHFLLKQTREGRWGPLTLEEPTAPGDQEEAAPSGAKASDRTRSSRRVHATRRTRATDRAHVSDPAQDSERARREAEEEAT